MARSPFAAVLWLIASCALVFQSLDAAQGATVWTGLTKSFTKPFGADPSLPANQDALTANVILTRGFSGGLFNIAAESGYDAFRGSPVDTEWATDINNPAQTIASTNYQNLGFTTWISAFGGGGTAGGEIPGRLAVVHLITDDIYLDLKFTSWTPGHGGDYTYLRSEPPSAPSPTGDYNGNHLVDAADYVLWRKTLTTAVSPNGSGADGNADGTINAGDYTFWRARFGNAAGAGSGSLFNTAVPEPATLALEFVPMLILIWQLRTR
jgi:hypothetical protein